MARKKKSKPLGNRNAMTIRVPLPVMFKLRAEARRRRKPPATLAGEILTAHYDDGPKLAAVVEAPALRYDEHDAFEAEVAAVNARVAAEILDEHTILATARDRALELADARDAHAEAAVDADMSNEEIDDDGREFCREY